MLASSARVLAKFPSDVVMVTMAVLPRCYKLLPSEPSSHVMEIQMNALEAFSQLGISSTPSLVKPAMDMLYFLWTKYTATLPACCNIKQLADILNAAFQLEKTEDAVQHASTFVVHLVNSLSDSQLDALEKEGVYKSLRSLLHHYDSIDATTLRHIIAGVGIFANVKAATSEILEENLYPILILAAQKFATDEAFQKMVWPLLILLCIRDKAFALAIAEMDAISSALTVIQTEGSSLMPVFKFITTCCQIDSIYYSHCLDNSDLVEHLFDVIKSDSASLGDKNNCADFIALICTKTPRNYLSRLIELKLVRKLEDICQAQPDVAVIPIYLAIEGLVSLLSQEQALKSPDAKSLINDFYAMDHHLFLQQALSSSIVYSNQSFLEVIYLSLQKLLKLITTEAMRRMCNKEFLEVYSISFVRDTIAFPALANRVVFTSHFFVFQMREKEPIVLLREAGFHMPVVELVDNGAPDIICTVLGLLSCLISKYFEFLKDVKPLLDANVPSLILQKAALYGRLPHSSFGDEMSRILLNLTSEKELSLKLYKEGFLEQLLTNLDNSYTPVVKKCIVHAIGNIALAGQNVKEVLFKESFHIRLLSMLSLEAEKGDPNYLSACCRVLHILASGDAAKRDFVEKDCVPLLINILKSRKDNPEICWRPLGLLSSLGFMAILNRHCILTKEVMDVVVKILKDEKHGKVLGYTMLVFLAYLQLDSGAASMRQMAIEDRIREVYQNPNYQKQSSEIERWGKHVLENQDLYTVATPTQTTPPCSLEDCRVSDWPYEYSSAGLNLLPLEDVYFEPKTPTAIQLTPDAKDQLRHLKLDPDLPIFRIGRVYGCTYGWCSNCDKEGASYELVIRVQSMSPMQYQHLIDNGWYRRGGVKMFRMMHNHSTVCCDWETRVSVAQFDFNSHKSYKKILRRMPSDRLTVEILPRHFSREAFDLYNSYHIIRHEKPQKSEFSYCEHVVDSPLANQTINGVEYGTFHQMYRLDGKLVAIGIVDVVPKGMVSIYMWYDVSKEVAKLSFGVYSALKEIEIVRERHNRDPTVEYYYLQGWNANNHKLSYKANYEPEEFYCPGISTNWVASKDKVNEEMERFRQEKAPQEAMDTAPGECVCCV